MGCPGQRDLFVVWSNWLGAHLKLAPVDHQGEVSICHCQADYATPLSGPCLDCTSITSRRGWMVFWNRNQFVGSSLFKPTVSAAWHNLEPFWFKRFWETWICRIGKVEWPKGDKNSFSMGFFPDEFQSGSFSTYKGNMGYCVSVVEVKTETSLKDGAAFGSRPNSCQPTLN